MPNFSSLARLEVPEKFLWVGGVGGVCKVIFMVNPTVVLRLGWGFDKKGNIVQIVKVLEELLTDFSLAMQHGFKVKLGNSHP